MKTYTIQLHSQDLSGPDRDGIAHPQPSGPAAASKAPENPAIVGIDLHPDIFDAVILRQGRRAADARKVGAYRQLPTGEIAQWASHSLDPQQHLLVIESTSNSFDVVAKLAACGFAAVIVESSQIGKLSDAFIEDDQIAAERVARAYLTGMAKAVWVPDPATREKRELLHAYQGAVADHTRAINEVKSYLTGFNIRPGKRNLHREEERERVRERMELTPVREAILSGLFGNLDQAKASRDTFYRLICQQMAGHSQMLSCLRVVGIGLINAFAIVAVVGDIGRFATANKLVSYLGLNPGRRKSGHDKDIRIGVGNRGRKDVRSLLIQGAQSVLRQSRTGKNKLAKWGFKLFARKGNRNVAVAATARKLACALYQILKGRAIAFEEQAAPLKRKLNLLSAALGTEGRKAAGLPSKTTDAVAQWLAALSIPESSPTKTPN